jgi:hypothetical protein
MRLDSLIIAIVVSVILLGLVVLAILGLRSTGEAAHETARAGGKKSGETASARRRASWRKRDRATLLPANATVTFAAERRTAGIDEVFEALDNDLVGLVPVKKGSGDRGAAAG